ncbi:MAG: DsbE family thiol:disulfide interchange protein [Acidobacteriota bacterium]
MRYAIPLVLFIGLVVFLALGLRRDPNGELPSALLNKAAPAFQLPQLDEPTRIFSPKEMQGKVWLLNVWASWCEPCREEHPWLVEFSRSNAVPIYGFNWKDDRGAALSLLKEEGNPYVLTVSDADGRVAIDYGVYGAPETYVIDRQGVIRLKKVGPLNKDIWDHEILPLVKQLNQ